jgi:pyruvate carboxylase
LKICLKEIALFKERQKVVEIAPAPSLDPKIRQNILSNAIKLAKHVGYQNAGTGKILKATF